MRLFLVSQIVILAASLAGCQHPDYSRHVLEISSMSQEKLTDWSAPVNGLCARVERANISYDDHFFMRLKNVGNKALTIPLANPQDARLNTFFAVELMDSDGWHVCHDIAGNGELSGQWEIPYVTLRPGEEALVMLAFYLGDWKERCSVVKMRLRVAAEGDGRWSGVLETPEKPVYACDKKELLLPTYFSEFSHNMQSGWNLSGNESKLTCLLIRNRALALMCELYEQKDVKELMDALMTCETDPNLRLFYACLSRKADVQAYKPSSPPTTSWGLMPPPSAEEVIRSGLHNADLDVFCSAVDAAFYDLHVSPNSPFRGELETIRKTLQSRRPSGDSSPEEHWTDSAARCVEDGFRELASQEEQERLATEPAAKLDKRQQIEQLLAELKSPMPYVMKGSHSADEVAGDIARNLRRLTGQPMGGDWRAWDLWWQTKGKAMDWKH